MLQPLDVGVFGPFSHAWLERCDDYMEEHLEEIPRDQFVKHYMDVQQNTFKDTTICAAFRQSTMTFSRMLTLPQVSTPPLWLGMPQKVIQSVLTNGQTINHGPMTNPIPKAAVTMKILIILMLVIGIQGKLSNIPMQQQLKHHPPPTHTFRPQFHLLDSIQKPQNLHSVDTTQRPIFLC